MKTFLLILPLVLMGCATTPPSIPIEPRTIIKFERIVTPIPNELLDIPDPVPNLPLDVLKTDDKAVAKWLLDSEERTLSLEAQIRRIRELYIKQLRESREAAKKDSVK